MKLSGIISVILIGTMYSCVALPPKEAAVEEVPTIQGTVADEEDNPIEHIMVTLDWGEGIENTVLYTSSTGTFKTEIPIEITEGEAYVELSLEDIDDIENGGLFEPVNDRILLYQDSASDVSEIITLDYRLSRATPSESSRQI